MRPAFMAAESGLSGDISLAMLSALTNSVLSNNEGSKIAAAVVLPAPLHPLSINIFRFMLQI